MNYPLHPSLRSVIFPGATLVLTPDMPDYEDVAAMDTDTLIWVFATYVDINAPRTNCIANIGTITSLKRTANQHISLTGDRRCRIAKTVMSEKSPVLTATVLPLIETHIDWDSDKLSTLKDLFYEAYRLRNLILQREETPPVWPTTTEVTEISWFVADNLKGSGVLKQQLLEISSPVDRLEEELTRLDELVRGMTLRAQINAVFKGDAPA